MTTDPLTKREMEVLWLVTEGLSNKIIADRLNLSGHTVKFHLTNAMKKTGTSSRTKLAVDFAIQQEHQARGQRTTPLEEDAATKRAWINGFATALAHMQRAGAAEGSICIAAQEGGITLAKAQNAGAHFFDLTALKKAKIT